jgi:RimJ/RimL family protein N-acetyltransferase
MLGPPKYPDHPAPSWEAFQQDYRESFFSDTPGGTGRNYIIFLGETKIGTIGFDNLNVSKGTVDLDIWMRAEEFCGHGYGPDAIDTLVQYLSRSHGVHEFRVDPSARNTRAIRAYRKCGFAEAENTGSKGPSDYSDTVVMVRTTDTEQDAAHIFLKRRAVSENGER